MQKIYLYRIFIFVLLSQCISISNAIAQDVAKPQLRTDTVKVKADRFIFIEDYVYYIARDTVLYLHDTVDYYIRKNNLEKTDKFYSQVEQKMSRTKLSRLMYGVFFQNSDGVKQHGEELSEMRFITSQGKTIKKTQLQHLDVFGTNINDTSIHSTNKYLTSANKVHIHTRPWVKRKNLTFKEGDKVNPSDLVNSERLLRRLDYIKDARIFVDNQGGRGAKRAKVIVVTKDVFPYNVLLSTNNNNSGVWGLSNINIAGIGHELEYNYIREGGSEFFYRVRNIGGTFIDSELIYANNLFRSGYGGNLDRQFVTQKTKYAGGFELSSFKFSDLDFDENTEEINRFFYDRYFRDIWVGRALATNIKSSLLGFNSKANVVISGRISKEDFSNGPITTPDTNFFLHDKRNFLIGIGLQSRQYYKDKFVISYGRTEDIPTGSSLGIVMGYQSAEFQNRYYLEFNYARGGYLNDFGYLNGILSLGEFFGSDGLTDGIMKIELDYFTRLYPFGQFKFRQFINITYTQALRPQEDILLRNQRDLGIRGASLFFLKTTGLFNIKFESLLFTPINFVGFRMATFAFLDASISTNDKSSTTNTEVYSGMGVGIRLRNDNLAFSTIQLRFGYYPSVPQNANNYNYNVATSTNLNIRDFDFKEPEILSFTQSR